MVNEVIIKTINLNCCFDSNCVLQNLNLEICKKEILGIIGPANSGKSTFYGHSTGSITLILRIHRRGRLFLKTKISILFLTASFDEE